tara:strand:- start:517 stop:873 length:357 start_codon:yes stop_codon:yes gene_type:complete
MASGKILPCLTVTQQNAITKSYVDTVLQEYENGAMARDLRRIGKKAIQSALESCYKARKKAERAPSPYNLYMKSCFKKGGDFGSCADEWKELPDTKKKPFITAANKAKAALHKKLGKK